MAPMSFLKGDKSTPTSESSDILPNAPTSPVPPSPGARPRKLQRLKGGSLSIRPGIFEREQKERPVGVDSAVDDASGAEVDIGRTIFGRPRGSSISEAGMTPERKRGWFSRRPTDDDSTVETRAASEMVISSPIPPSDGQPLRSPKAVEELMELQRQVREVTLGSDAISLDSMVNGISPHPPRPVTPPNRSTPKSEFPTPLSPPRRPAHRNPAPSPRIVPLVYASSPASALPPNLLSDETLSPRKTSDSSSHPSWTASPRIASDSSTATSGLSDTSSGSVPDRSEFFSPALTAARSMSPGIGGKDMAWLSRKPSTSMRRKPVPESGTTVDLTDDTPTLRSVNQMPSRRESPDSSTETSTDDKADEDSETLSSGMDDVSIGRLGRTPRSFKASLPESRSESLNGRNGTAAGGYMVEVVCTDAGGSRWEDRELKEGEEIRWEVVIRRTANSSSPGGMTFAATPIPVSGSSTSSVAPPSASSINLSLSLDRPNGKMVFISLPVDPQVTPIKRKPSTRMASGSSIRSEAPPSPSPSASSPSRPYFPDSYSGGATQYPTPPTSALPSSPRSPAMMSTRRQGPPPSIASASTPPLSSSAFTSPPASPRDITQRRRKASLQGGILFTPNVGGL